jgi:hypothetical protein
MALVNAFWTIMSLVCIFMWLMLLIRVLVDIFRSHNLSGWGKAGSTILVIVLPVLGVLVYLVAREGSMHERRQGAATARQQADQYRQGVARSSSSATELAKLRHLHDAGTISDVEFEQAKSEIQAA